MSYIKIKAYLFESVRKCNHLLFGLGGFLQLVLSIRHSDAIFLHDIVCSGDAGHKQITQICKCEKVSEKQTI